MAIKDRVPVDPRREAEFDGAFGLLSRLVDLTEADRRFPLAGQAVYTTRVVLWMLIYQRMSPDPSLEAAVKKLIRSHDTLLPNNKRVRDRTLSHNTGAYGRARSRLPRDSAEWLCDEVSQSLIEASPPSWRGRRVFMIDGTTITLEPTAPLRRAFPPASNQHGTGVWPVALLVLAHELASGAALKPQVGAMYGPQAVSETALVRGCFEQMPPESIVLADSGYGIFAVAFTARQAERQFVLRLTQLRFAALRRQATVSARGQMWTTYQHEWRPSAKERLSHPDLPDEAAVDVWLHEIHVSSSLTLQLVTDVPDSAPALAELYRQRTDIEVDIRNFKVVLGAENLRARGVEMFYKELLTSLVAYNLVIQFRRQAAQLIEQPPRRLSFKRTWTTFRLYLLSQSDTDPIRWRDRFRTALGYATQDKLPNRPGRSYPREAYRRRPKSTQFQKRIPKTPPEP